MEIQTLKASRRESKGTGGAKRTRRQGAIPVVLYGGGQEPITLKVDVREFTRVTHGRGGEHAIVQLQLEDSPEFNSPALLKEVQHHPLRGDVIHADFQRIRLDERITTLVPVRLVGQARGIVDGGILDHQLREVEVECLALEVPEEFTIDVSDLGIGDNVHVSELQALPNVTIKSDPERVIAAVIAPRQVKEEVPAEAAEAAPTEPEVIGEKERAKESEEGPEEKEKGRGKEREKK